MDNTKERSITVFYLPLLGAKDEKHEVKPGDKAGYFIHSNEQGQIIGYRFFINEKTVIVPKEVVLKIEVIL
jgi:hypothetical protein